MAKQPRHRGFWTTTENGQPFHVQGDPNMKPETLRALQKLAQIASDWITEKNAKELEMANQAAESDAVKRDISRVQIYKHVTKDRLLDIGDMISLERKQSKIAVSLIAFDEEYHASTRVRHYIDVPDMKLLCYDVLNGFFTEWTDYKGTPEKDEDGNTNGQLKARVFTMRKDGKYRKPCLIKIDNGVGEQLPGGAVKMVETTDSLTILLSEWDVRKMALAVLDYIRDWEVVNFRKRQEAQTQIIALPAAGTNHEQEQTKQ